ncbi:MAG: aconitase X [Burkholderiaceae bacterium]
MKLTDEEDAMLRGAFGTAVRLALEHQLAVGRFFGARDMVPVSQAHIMADTESLGQAGVRWLEQLAEADEGGGRVRIPTITDPRGTDFTHAQALGQADWMIALEQRAIAAFTRMGVTMTDTCINYQTVLPATRGEHVAYGDTGVVIYTNSVNGARSNYEGGPSC